MALARALTIAGSDSGGGAGIQADLKTFTALGVYGMSALTAVTAQNTLGVMGVYPLTPAHEAQLDTVLSDIGTDAAKTGMLFDAPIIGVVANRVRHYGVKNLVVDPVMITKGGHPLLLAQAQVALRDQLLPLAAVVTPNLPEAEALTGMTIRGRSDMVEAGAACWRWAPALSWSKAATWTAPADDLLCTAAGTEWLHAERIETRHTHGTGCTFSAAIAAGLAHGLALQAAVVQAKSFITLAIERAPGLGAGHGPTNHVASQEVPEMGLRQHVRDRRPLVGTRSRLPSPWTRSPADVGARPVDRPGPFRGFREDRRTRHALPEHQHLDPSGARDDRGRR